MRRLTFQQRVSRLPKYMKDHLQYILRDGRPPTKANLQEGLRQNFQYQTGTLKDHRCYECVAIMRRLGLETEQ